MSGKGVSLDGSLEALGTFAGAWSAQGMHWGVTELCLEGPFGNSKNHKEEVEQLYGLGVLGQEEG